MVGVVAAVVLVVAPLPLAPDALAASGAKTCVTSQLQQVPGVQDLSGSVPVVFIHGINSSAAIWNVSSGGSIAGQAQCHGLERDQRSSQLSGRGVAVRAGGCGE